MKEQQKKRSSITQSNANGPPPDDIEQKLLFLLMIMVLSIATGSIIISIGDTSAYANIKNFFELLILIFRLTEVILRI